MEPQLVNDYVATGKVLFEFKDLAFLGDESIQAAQAADCALDQGKFWPYHDTLYANQHGENQGSFTTERLKAIAQTVGLNMSTFDHCLESQAHKTPDPNSGRQRYGDHLPEVRLAQSGDRR